MYQSRSILIIEQNEEDLNELTKMQAQSEYPILIKSSISDAQKVVTDKNIDLLGVFISFNLKSNENEMSFIAFTKFSKAHRPSVPVFGIVDSSENSLLASFYQNGGKAVIQRPYTLKQIIELVAPVAFKFESQEEQDPTDAQYVPIRASDFISGSISQFNVFIKLSSGRYLKLLQAGDAFTPERLKNYLDKGVEYFYILASDQEKYVRYMSLIAKALNKSEKLSSEVKMIKTMAHGEETMKYLKKHGLSEKSMSYASNFVENVIGVVEKLDIKKDETFNQFFKDVVTYEHGVGTAMIASLISHVSGIENINLVQIVGLAAMFHDIGLSNMPQNVKTEDESLMNEEEKKLFHKHPLIGAQILEKIPGTHPSVIQAILQHHERRNQSESFVPGIKVKVINKVAEIIGISDEYLNIMNKHKGLSLEEIKNLLEAKVFPHFSPIIVDAFKIVYFKPFYPGLKKV
jgi:putative nucleotidyltransferase with HDIG domain